MTDADLTEDHILGGRVRLLQPRKGYRVGVDAVLLAAAVPAKPGETVLDLGCGVGAVSLCLAARVPRLILSGLDLLEENTSIAGRNARANGVELELFTGDLGAMPESLKQRSFDHVVTNPPYFRRDMGPAAGLQHRDIAMGEALPLPLWIDAAIRRLRPRGRLTAILSADRTPELLAAVAGRLGGLRLLGLCSRRGEPASRIILSGRKDSRAPFQLASPLILHRGDRHLSDADDYTPELNEILKGAAPIV